MDKVRIEHYSDVLCVWAYVAQIRTDELVQTFGDAIEFDYKFVDVFGDCRTRLAQRWADRGGMPAYGEHVRGVVGQFDHVSVHPKIWTENIPQTSMSCHAFLRSVHLVDSSKLANAAWALRLAFFGGCIDVSSRTNQLAIAEELSIDRAAIEQQLDSGRAYCGVSADYRNARDNMVTMSPTLLFNDGRQRLTGNVGYRVIEANVRELLHNPKDVASWC